MQADEARPGSEQHQEESVETEAKAGSEAGSSVCSGSESLAREQHDAAWKQAVYDAEAARKAAEQRPLSAQEAFYAEFGSAAPSPGTLSGVQLQQQLQEARAPSCDGSGEDQAIASSLSGVQPQQPLQEARAPSRNGSG